MIALLGNTRIWIAAGVTDLQRGFTGLSALVQTKLEESPFSGHVFVFWGRRGDRQPGWWPKKPRSWSHPEEASASVVAVTAWEMPVEYAHVVAGQSVLILGAGGNVGAYGVQFATRTGLDIVAIAGSKDLDLVRSLGVKTTLDYRARNSKKPFRRSTSLLTNSSRFDVLFQCSVRPERPCALFLRRF